MEVMRKREQPSGEVPPPVPFVSVRLLEVTLVGKWSSLLPVSEMLLLPASDVFPAAAWIPVHSARESMSLSPWLSKGMGTCCFPLM